MKFKPILMILDFIADTILFSITTKAAALVYAIIAIGAFANAAINQVPVSLLLGALATFLAIGVGINAKRWFSI